MKESQSLYEDIFEKPERKAWEDEIEERIEKKYLKHEKKGLMIQLGLSSVLVTSAVPAAIHGFSTGDTSFGKFAIGVGVFGACHAVLEGKDLLQNARKLKVLKIGMSENKISEPEKKQVGK